MSSGHFSASAVSPASGLTAAAGCITITPGNDPHLGRFIQPDTLAPDPLNPRAWNRFSYVYNNPTGYVDPSGHFIPAAVAVPLLFIAGGALAGELAYVLDEHHARLGHGLGYLGVVGGRNYIPAKAKQPMRSRRRSRDAFRPDAACPGQERWLDIICYYRGGAQGSRVGE